MRKRDLLTAALPAMALFAGATWSAAALADDPILTKAPVVSAPAAPTICQGVPDFFLGSCQLAYYGVRVYGVIDVGGGYQTHGAPWDPNFPQGSSYLVQKMNREAMWTQAPNALSRSHIGVLVDEPFAPGWKFIGQYRGRTSIPIRCNCRTDRSRLQTTGACPARRPNRQQRFEPRGPILQFDWATLELPLRRTRHAHLFSSKLIYAGRRVWPTIRWKAPMLSRRWDFPALIAAPAIPKRAA